MNRNILVTVASVILIVLATGYYFMNRASVSPAAPQEVQSSVQPSPTTTTEKATLKDFLTMQGTQKCDFSDPDNGSSGTVYLNSGKMRGDFSTNASGKVSMTHMINDGKDAYIWMDDQTTGFKTSIDAVEQMSGQTGVAQTVDINKKVDYKCESWTADPVKFTVPVEIKFQDMSKMMEDAMKRMPSTSPMASVSLEDNKAACSACDNLDGNAKDQCKRALKCN